MKLIQDWRNAWRWYSVHASATGFVLSSAAAALALASSAGSLGGVLPMWAVLALFAVIFAAALAGRLISQSKDDGQ